MGAQFLQQQGDQQGHAGRKKEAQSVSAILFTVGSFPYKKRGKEYLMLRTRSVSKQV
jgi:hypothetical protein